MLRRRQNYLLNNVVYKILVLLLLQIVLHNWFNANWNPFFVYYFVYLFIYFFIDYMLNENRTEHIPNVFRWHAILFFFAKITYKIKQVFTVFYTLSLSVQNMKKIWTVSFFPIGHNRCLHLSWSATSINENEK